MISERAGGDDLAGVVPGVEVDFYRDLRAFVLSMLPHEPGAREELEAESTSELLIHYFNWYCRLVPQTRRRVHKSTELKRKMKDLPTAARRALREIEEDVSRGSDLTRFLSRDIRYGYISRKKAPKKNKHRRDRDPMLYDWGLHHLHLSTVPEEDGFVERTEDLLFAAFLSHNAYLIDITPHKSWYLRSLLHTIVLNWPGSGLVVPMKGIVGLAESYSEREGQELREGGVAANMFEFQDRVWVPRDFISTAGTSMRATRRAGFILTEAQRLQELLRSDPVPVMGEIEKALGPVTEPRLKFFMEGLKYGILEETTSTFLVVGRLAE